MVPTSHVYQGVSIIYSFTLAICVPLMTQLLGQ